MIEIRRIKEIVHNRMRARIVEKKLCGFVVAAHVFSTLISPFFILFVKLF